MNKDIKSCTESNDLQNNKGHGKTGHGLPISTNKTSPLNDLWIESSYNKYPPEMANLMKGLAFVKF